MDSASGAALLCSNGNDLPTTAAIAGASANHPDLRGAFCEAESLRLEAEFLAQRNSSRVQGQQDGGLSGPNAIGMDAAGSNHRHPTSIGIALSGGGVRAAAFHCGLFWALAAEGMMKDVLHMSAVSGGGYTAASLATHIVQSWEEVATAQSVDAWYQEVVARTILRMQHNIGFIARCAKPQWSYTSKTLREEV